MCRRSPILAASSCVPFQIDPDVRIWKSESTSLRTQVPLEKKSRGEAYLPAWSKHKYLRVGEEGKVFDTQIFHWLSSWEFASDLTQRFLPLP